MARLKVQLSIVSDFIRLFIDMMKHDIYLLLNSVLYNLYMAS